MATERMFVVAVDASHPDFDVVAVKSILRGSPMFSGWWNYIPGCFLVTTKSTADETADEIRRATGQASVLVIEADPKASEGWLPDRGWDWIRRREAKTDLYADEAR